MTKPRYQVTRAHLKKACDQRDWDLLDKLLELDDKHINDNALFTDGWGEWWGLLYECVLSEQEDGVRVLLARGAKRHVSSWGDGLELTVLELAEEKPRLLALLQSKTPLTYVRQHEPRLPQSLTAVDEAVNRQGRVRDETGLVFPTEAFDNE